MSIGFGLGDAVFALKGLWTVTTLLQGEAVDEFGRFERVRRDVQKLSRLIKYFSHDPQHENLFLRESREIERLLSEFREKIRELRPFLGRHRERNVRGCLHKVRWPLHSKKLEQIRQDLVFQLRMITMKQQFCQKGLFNVVSSARRPFMEHFFMRNSFDLEDPFGEFHRFDFFSVASWEALHEVLLRIFPLGYRGHEIIQSHRYLLHKSDSFAEILCNSPSIRPIRDVIKPQELVVMSGQARTHPVGIRELIRDRIIQIGPVPPERSRAKRPKIRHFRRVTLCTSQWPEFSQNRTREMATNLLRETTQGLERMKQVLDSEDLPFAKAAALINTRFWFARRNQAFLRFVTSSLRALAHNVPLAVWSLDDTRLLDDFVSRVEAGTLSFITAHLEARCFLWMFWEMLQLEAKILSSCAKLLDTWTCPDNSTRQETPLALKIFSLPHIALLVPWRLTFDLAEDIVEWFGKRQPLYLPTAIQHLITRSGNISLHYYLHGGLSTYARAYRTSGDRLYLDWMEEAMRSEGETINTKLTRVQLQSLIEGGYI
ncbi:hypothetical protein FOC1_g10001049 [Fusarium oxysporum f. sp. cubense race 1]|uniref:Uncharacterized protein n=1 Tax=Fusarium oxysporum f. sp. cubense (strain race 1) TaxID=1229664 RepID=N4UGQ6_FUSC1|nr:hypothetical protein FOC1_g10001049 [Fusarium oxysporum f. sp. cubense race 1]